MTESLDKQQKKEVMKELKDALVEELAFQDNEVSLPTGRFTYERASMG